MTPAEQLGSGILTPALILDVFLKLGIVLILIYLSLRLLRRYAQQAPVLPADHPDALPAKLGKWLSPWVNQNPARTAVRTLQVHPLNRQVTLYLIECEGRRLLLSVSNQQVQRLSEWPADTPTPNLDRYPGIIPDSESMMTDSSKSQVQGEQI